MREHEVPTHVQAEDHVLLWFTFPQIVAITAVCALAYGAYRYAPVGPSGVRMALAVVVGLAGIAAVVGQIGGRRLPLVIADLLRFRLGPRLYAGTPAQLLRSEPPAPPPASPGPLTLLAGRARRRIRRLRRGRERRNGRRRLSLPGRTGRLAGWKKRLKDAVTRRAARENRRRKRWFAVLTVASLALLVLASHQAVLADEGLIEEGWNIEEIEYEIPEPIPGRRLYMERLEVSGDRARVSLRAATDLEVLALAFGGEESRPLRMWWPATLGGGESNDFDLPLSGESPSLDFSWEDSLGQAGAISLEGRQLPYPLPSFEGELCDLRLVSVEWVPGTVSGAVSSECATTVEERVDVDVAAGHHSQTVTAVIEGEITAIEGTLRVDSGGATAIFPIVPGGETRFSVQVGRGEMVHTVAIEVAFEATLEVEIPPLLRLTHRPERTEELSGTVTVERPGVSRWVSRTVLLTHDDGTTTEHEVSAYLTIPRRTVRANFTYDYLHEERVEAEVVDRPPTERSRSETGRLSFSLWADSAFRTLNLPEPEETVTADQTSLTGEETESLLSGLEWWERPG